MFVDVEINTGHLRIRKLLKCFFFSKEITLIGGIGAPHSSSPSNTKLPWYFPYRGLCRNFDMNTLNLSSSRLSS